MSAASDPAYPQPWASPVTPTREFCPLKKERERDVSRDAAAEQRVLSEGIQVPVSGLTCTQGPGLGYVRYLMYTKSAWFSCEQFVAFCLTGMSMLAYVWSFRGET